MNRWVGSIQRFPPESRKELQKSIKEIYALSKREKNPVYVDPNQGWSPYLAKDFLKTEGLPTHHYQRFHENEWFAGSDYLEIGDGILKNNIAYYLNGNEYIVTELKLILNLNNPEYPTEAENRFQKVITLLIRAALISETYHQDFRTNDTWDIFIAGKQIRLDRQIWKGSIPGGYSRSLSIKVVPNI